MAIDRTEPARSPETPVPGHYRVRLVRGGPWVAARIRCDNGVWSLFLGGVLTGAPHANPWAVHPRMEWVAFSARVTEVEYLRLLNTTAAAHPGDPLADPSAAVDFEAAPPLYRRKTP